MSATARPQRKPAARVPPTALPWQLPRIADADIFAAQAVAQGRADAQQQRRFCAFLRTLAGADKMSFWPGGEDGRRATDFAEGKRWVADQLRRIARLQPKDIDPRGEPPAMPTDDTTEVSDD